MTQEIDGIVNDSGNSHGDTAEIGPEILAGLVRVELGNFWDRYQAWTIETAVYPDKGKGTVVAQQYVELGLMDEIGEIAGKFKKALRGDSGCSGYAAVEALKTNEIDKKTGLPKREMVRDELGDVIYYVARYLDEKTQGNEPDLPEELRFGLRLSDIRLNGFVTTEFEHTEQVVDTVKGLSRYLGMLENSDNQEDVEYALSSIFFDLKEIAEWLGFTIEEVAAANKAKLTSRSERGVIKGSGDNR